MPPQTKSRLPGQIALYARLSGKTPALTKLIEGSS